MNADPLPDLVPSHVSDQGSTEIAMRSPPSLTFQRPAVGAPLLNLGNTCFMNAVLQCLTHTVPLVEKIIDSKPSTCCCGEKEMFCPFSALKYHIERCLLPSQYYVSPKDIAENLSKISPGLQLGQQEDAHEFLQSLLDAVHTCCHNCTAKDCPSTLDEDSIVKQVFGGRLKSQLQCSSCGHCSDTYEPLLDLSLEIGDANSIIDALLSFTKVEKIGDDVKLTCDGCKAQVSMEKQLKLDQAPEVLALHLKRFENNGFFSNKIFRHVEYPLELDLSQFLICPPEEVQLKYDLYAIVVHLGSSYSGHYFSIIRSSESSWYQMDDTLVTKLSEREVLDQTAYILFYIKKGSCWFSSLLDTERIRCLERNADNSPASVLDYVDSDVQLDSSLAGPSTPKAMPEKSESTTNYDQTSSISPTHDASPIHRSRYDASKSIMVLKQASGSGTEKTVKDESIAPADLLSPPTNSHKRHIPDQFEFDMFDDEPLEEGEDAIMPQIQIVPKVKKTAAAKPAVEEALKDERMIESFNRGLKGMSKSRRENLMKCYRSSLNKSEKHHSKYIGKKRRLC